MKKLLIYFFLIIISNNAYAIFGPLQFSPMAPTTNDVVQFSLQTGGCDIFVDTLNTTEIIGNLIRVRKVGVSQTDFQLCLFPAGISTTTLGTFPPGTYSVELYRIQNSNPNIVNLVQSGSFTVVQGVVPPLVAVPNFSIYGLILLAFIFVVFGSYAVIRSRF